MHEAKQYSVSERIALLGIVSKYVATMCERVIHWENIQMSFIMQEIKHDALTHLNMGFQR